MAVFVLSLIELLFYVIAMGQPLQTNMELCDYTACSDSSMMDAAYTGAVVEYTPYVKWTSEGGRKILRRNTKAYIDFASEAKQRGADILVFPEYGLTGFKYPDEESNFLSLVQRLPPPKDSVVPCHQDDNDHTYEAVKHLSCAARDHKIYLVVNLVEWEEQTIDGKITNAFYNTQIVLDRNGKLIARHRKMHLFLEDPLIPGKEDISTALFQTDFGVTFTLQICFEILYKEPAVLNILSKKVLDVAMSTAWMDELPFLTAPQVFSSWAKGLGVNLLVSNYHNLSYGMTGSGIFPETTNAPFFYTYRAERNSSLIVKRITTRRSPTVNHPTDDRQAISPKPSDETGLKNRELQSLLYKYENLSNYTSEPLRKTSQVASQRLCHEGLCCNATYRYSTPSGGGEGTYRILAYSGDVYKVVYKMFVQVCAVVYCSHEDLNSCGKLESRTSPKGIHLHSLRGSFNTEFIFPSVLGTNFTPFGGDSWLYSKENLGGNWLAEIAAHSSDLEEIIVASLFARIY